MLLGIIGKDRFPVIPTLYVVMGLILDEITRKTGHGVFC
jgi:hypothetical protein